MNKPGTESLWPFGVRKALLWIPVAWLLFLLIALAAHFLRLWPGQISDKWMYLVPGVISFIPLSLVLIEFVVAHSTSVEFRGVKINFSGVAQGDRSLVLKSNAGIPGRIIMDSNVMQILHALKRTSAQEVSVIDIEDGKAWWLTRVLALSATAARLGKPKIIVFIGRDHNLASAFLGYAEPASIVLALLNEDKKMLDAYAEAQRTTAALTVFYNPVSQGSLLPPPLDTLLPWATSENRFMDDGEVNFGQVLLEHLARNIEDAPTEPPSLTLSELHRVFDPILYTAAIDLNAPMKDQVAHFLKIDAPYIALTRGGKYDSIMERAAGERLLLRQLVEHALGSTTPAE